MPYFRAAVRRPFPDEIAENPLMARAYRNIAYRNITR
jgi:hypothetical protein